MSMMFNKLSVYLQVSYFSKYLLQSQSSIQTRFDIQEYNLIFSNYTRINTTILHYVLSLFLQTIEITNQTKKKNYKFVQRIEWIYYIFILLLVTYLIL